MVKYSVWVQKNSARGRSGGAGTPDVHLRPYNISETTRPRKLKVKTPLLLDIVKYSIWV